MSKDTQPSLFSFFPSTSSTSSSAVPPSKESSAGPSNPRHSSSSSKLRKIKKTIRKVHPGYGVCFQHSNRFSMRKLVDGKSEVHLHQRTQSSCLLLVQFHSENIQNLTGLTAILRNMATREVTRAAIHCEPCRSRFVRENKRSVPPGKRPSDGPVTIEHLRPLRRKLCSRGDKVFVWGVPVPEGVDEDIPKGLASVSRDIPRESKSKNDLSIPTSETSQSSSQIRPNMPESKSDENHPSSQ
eukprot:315766_1